MKPDIHPDNYRTVLFYDSGADQGWLIRSCANTHGKTMVWKDGVEYPLLIPLPRPTPYTQANNATSISKAAPASSTNVTNP